MTRWRRGISRTGAAFSELERRRDPPRPRRLVPGARRMTNVGTKRTVQGLGEAAAELAACGCHVFPCLPGGKRPAIDRWEQRASADPGHVRQAWGGRYAGHNLGLACGPSRLVVVDLDCHGSLPDDWKLPGIIDGRDVFAQVSEWARQPWPRTRWSSTPSGGW